MSFSFLCDLSGPGVVMGCHFPSVADTIPNTFIWCKITACDLQEVKEVLDDLIYSCHKCCLLAGEFFDILVN
jgi:hypothetical protein